MCVADRHDMTLAVKVVLNLNTTNQLGPLRFYLAQTVPFKRLYAKFLLLQNT